MLEGRNHLKTTVCYRPIPALSGELHAVTASLERQGHVATQIHDEPADHRTADSVVAAQANPGTTVNIAGPRRLW